MQLFSFKKYGHGTIVSVSPFDAEADCELLRKAMRGAGEFPVIYSVQKGPFVYKSFSPIIKLSILCSVCEAFLIILL